MILTPEELKDYVPSLSLSPPQAEGVILRATALAESEFGANRVLEMTEYTEIRDLHPGARMRLAYFPISPPVLDELGEIVQEGGVVSVEIRGQSGFSFAGSGGGIPVSQGWVALSEEEYSMDYAKNSLEIDASVIPFTGVIGSVNPFLFSGRPMSQRHPPPQIRVVYNAGFDFTTTPYSPTIKKMKSAIAGIAEAMFRDQSGIKSESSDSDRISYFSFAETVSKYTDFLTIFHKYRPRSVMGG